MPTPQEILNKARSDALALFDDDPARAASHFTESLEKNGATALALARARIREDLKVVVVNRNKRQFENLLNSVELSE